MTRSLSPGLHHHDLPPVHDAPVREPQTWICVTCGSNQPGTSEAPSMCLLCADGRWGTAPDDVRWTTPEQAPRDGYRSDVREVEPGITGFGVDLPLGSGHRGLLVQTPLGNLLWDPPAHLDEHAVAEIRRRGGVQVLAAGDPRTYGAIARCSRLFDVPALISEQDAHWLADPDIEVRTWTGTVTPLQGVTLVQCGGGRYPGTAIAHVAHAANGAGALLSGDTMLAGPDADGVTFAWNARGRLPMSLHVVRSIADAVRPYPFERVYSGEWAPVLRQDGRSALEDSVRHHTRFVRGEISF